MANTSITEVNSFFAGTVKAGTKGQNVQNAESFSTFFDKTRTTDQNQTRESKTDKTENAESLQNHAKIQKNRTADNVKGKPEKTKTVTDAEEMEEAVEAAAGAMVETIAETFDMTAEEVEQVMDELGMTALDLLNPENLTQLVANINPETDAFSIMTNEELFTDLKGLMDTAEEFTNQLAEQFGITKEELTAFVDAMKQQIPADTNEGIFENVTDPSVDTRETPAEIPVEVVVENTEETSAVVKAEEPTVQAAKPETKEAEPIQDSLRSTVLPETKETETGKRETSENKNEFQHSEGKNFGQQVVNQLAQAVENVTAETTTYGADGQEILRQITDYIKVHVGQETTEMELQLHPASLGNIKVQIASNGGVLTATFTTENETVKAALEGQMLQLKESFEQQGLKVENVEVNVSAQGFDRNLDQQEQNQQNPFDTKANKGKTRRLRLNDLDEIPEEGNEELSEGERIAADMMRQNGNQVDYMV